MSGKICEWNYFYMTNPVNCFGAQETMEPVELWKGEAGLRREQTLMEEVTDNWRHVK